MNYDAIQTLGKERSLAYMNTVGIVECNRRGKKERERVNGRIVYDTWLVLMLCPDMGWLRSLHGTRTHDANDSQSGRDSKHRPVRLVSNPALTRGDQIHLPLKRPKHGGSLEGAANAGLTAPGVSQEHRQGDKTGEPENHGDQVHSRDDEAMGQIR